MSPALDPEEMLALFPGARDVAYLNTAAQCLLPEPVVEAMHRAAVQRGRRGVLAYEDDMAVVERARRRAATLIDAARPEQVAFTAGTTDGIARVAQGLDWRDGDRVVLADCEYPANVFPWAALADRGVRLDVVPADQGRVPAERIVERIGDRTRVVALSHVQFGSGYRSAAAAVGAACRERGALFVLDAIQSAGAVPVDVEAMRVDALAVDGRKWLMGPPGCGFLYVGERCLERLAVTGAGDGSVTTLHEPLAWREWIDPDGQVDVRPWLRPDALRFQGGFPDVIGIAGLDAALALAERLGHRAIQVHIAELVERAAAGAAAAGLSVFGPQRPEERAGIVSIAVPGDTEALVADLLRRGIAVAARDGRVRISPHVHSTGEHVDRVLEVLAASAAG